MTFKAIFVRLILSVTLMGGIFVPELTAAGPIPRVLPATVPAAAPPAWQPDDLQLGNVQAQAEIQTRFLNTVNDILRHEDVDPTLIKVELAPLGGATQSATGHWRALAQVFIDKSADGTVVKRLVFDPSYWLNPSMHPFANHRLAKIMWHEIHHLKYLPLNLHRSVDLAKEFPPAHKEDIEGWENAWIRLLEPMEEMAAERTCIERYQKVFGPLPDVLLSDSQGDMRKYSSIYHDRFAALFKKVRDPQKLLTQFSSDLSIDPKGNILP